MPLSAPPNVFQTYLHTALPFRRKSSSATTSTSNSFLSWRRNSGVDSHPTSPTSSAAISTPGTSPDLSSSASGGFRWPSPPKLGGRWGSRSSTTEDGIREVTEEDNGTSEQFLNGSVSHLRCAGCLADLCLTSQIISKGFTGRHGRAYLVSPHVFTGISCPSASSPPPQTRGPKKLFSRSSASGQRQSTGRTSNVVATATPNLSWTTTLFRTSFADPGFYSAAQNPSANNNADNLPNTHVHRAVPRTLATGAHTVSDVTCAHCGATLGWKYVNAEDESQRYKVGKFILETRRVIRWVGWEEDDEPSRPPTNPNSTTSPGRPGGARNPPRRRDSHFDSDSDSASESEDEMDEIDDDGAPGPSSSRFKPGYRGTGRTEEEEEIEFDSQDEDECDDLFAGIWTPQLAKKRRERRREAWERGD